jgi:Domain of unknown function (DUF5122) beta-propeller
MNPIHGFAPAATYVPNLNLADMHYLTPAEANSVKAQGQASGQIPAINANKVLPLEYGFVARSSTGRTISPSTCTTVNCNKGKVTFAYSFPLDADIAKQPRAYKMWYVVANEFIPTWSQVLNGETSTVAGVPFANPLISTHRTRILENGAAGKTFVPASGVDMLENVCSVKTANAVGADPVLRHPSASSSPVGAFDACFGEKGVRGKQFNSALDESTSISVDPVTDEIVIAAAGEYPNLGISIVRFDRTGKQTLNVHYAPSDSELGMTTIEGTFPALDITVKKVIVSKFQRQIYVFGFAVGGPNELGILIRSPYLFSFSSTGQILSRAIFSYTISDGSFDGDMYLDQQTANPPIVYAAFRDANFTDQISGRRMHSYLGGGTSYFLPDNPAFAYAGSDNPIFASAFGVLSGFTLSANSGRLVVAEYDKTNSSIVMVATTLTGAFDTSWGGGGTTVVSKASLGLQPADNFYLASSKLLSDGKLLLAGTVYNVPLGSSGVILTRTNAVGAIDTSFAGGVGVATYPCDVIGLGANFSPRLAVRSNGEIFVVSYGSAGKQCVSKRDASGVNISRKIYDLYAGQSQSHSNDVQLTASGRLVIGGLSYGVLNSVIVGLIKQ